MIEGQPAPYRISLTHIHTLPLPPPPPPLPTVAAAVRKQGGRKGRARTSQSEKSEKLVIISKKVQERTGLEGPYKR